MPNLSGSTGYTGSGATDVIQNLTTNTLIATTFSFRDLVCDNLMGDVVRASKAVTVRPLPETAGETHMNVAEEILRSRGVTDLLTPSGSDLTAAGGLAATITTPDQPNITSVGTLNGLIVLGATTLNGALSVTGPISGTLFTSAQPNITSVGTLSSLNVSGDLTVSGLLTAPNLSLGSSVTLTGLAVTGVSRHAGRYLDTTPVPQGAHIGWNHGVTGMTDFINKSGAAPGGWNWFNSTGDGSNFSVGRTLAMNLSPVGVCNISGRVTSAGYTSTNTVEFSGSNAFLIPRSVFSHASRDSAFGFTSGTSLFAVLHPSSIIHNRTPSPFAYGMQSTGYVAEFTGMYRVTLTCRLSDGSGLASIRPRVFAGGWGWVFPTDWFIEADPSSRRCCSFTHMIQLNSGQTYDILSQNGTNMEWVRLTVELVSTV